MLSKLIQFIKNLHPIRNFARPINQPRNNYATVSFSYQSLARELAEPVRLETVIPTFHEQETLSGNVVTASHDEHEEQESTSVMVMQKVEIMRETDFILASEVQSEEYQPAEKVIKLRVKEAGEEEPLVLELPGTVMQEMPMPVPEKAPGKKRVVKKTAKKAEKIVKKPAKTKKSASVSPRRKKEVPPEARGFGY